MKSKNSRTPHDAVFSSVLSFSPTWAQMFPVPCSQTLLYVRDKVPRLFPKQQVKLYLYIFCTFHFCVFTWHEKTKHSELVKNVCYVRSQRAQFSSWRTGAFGHCLHGLSITGEEQHTNITAAAVTCYMWLDLGATFKIVLHHYVYTVLTKWQSHLCY